MRNNNDLGVMKLPKSDRSMKNLTIILIILVILLGILDLILVMLFGFDNEGEQVVSPTVTPSVVIQTVMPSVITGTVTVPTPTVEADSYKYVTRDCEIELVAEKTWHATVPGRFGACVALGSDVVPGVFTDFREYDDTLIAIVPFTEDSDFTPNGPKTSEEYLKSLSTLTNKFDPTKDFLYSKKTISVGGKNATEAKIYNAKLGDTTQIFYSGFNGEYIIIWGGKNAVKDEVSIREIISSIQYLDQEETEE